MTAAGVDAAPPPRAALWLGGAGLLPFAAGALLVWLVRPELRGYAAFALVAYAAAIASFLGGIHWGLAMRAAPVATSALAWGVVPSLLAWFALLMSPRSGLVVAGALLLLTYAVDRRAYPRFGAGRWLTLRFRLSTVAALCCFIGAAGS